MDDFEQNQQLPQTELIEDDAIALSKYNRRDRNRQNTISKLKAAPQIKKGYEIDDILEQAMMQNQLPRRMIKRSTSPKKVSTSPQRLESNSPTAAEKIRARR